MWLGVPGHDRRLLRIRLSYYPINALYIRLTRPVPVTNCALRVRSLTLTLLVFARWCTPCAMCVKCISIMYI